MSTKKIRECVEWVRSMRWGPDSAPAKLALEALAEVERIERAAKEFSDPAQGMSAKSMELLEQIAKDAP